MSKEMFQMRRDLADFRCPFLYTPTYTLRAARSRVTNILFCLFCHPFNAPLAYRRHLLPSSYETALSSLLVAGLRTVNLSV